MHTHSKGTPISLPKLTAFDWSQRDARFSRITRRAGVRVLDCLGTTILRNRIHGISGAGLLFYGGGDGVGPYSAEDNEIYETGLGGIEVQRSPTIFCPFLTPAVHKHTAMHKHTQTRVRFARSLSAKQSRLCEETRCTIARVQAYSSACTRGVSTRKTRFGFATDHTRL